MKSLYKHILLLLMVFSVSSLSHAEIYKWKDKNGAIRYSDTPPPSNIKQESITGKKKAVLPTGQAPLSPVEIVNPVTSKEPTKAPVNNEDEAAKKRQADAEVEKKSKLDKEKQEAAKAENCKIAKANLENYIQGGRIYKINEKGEREYVSDAGLEEGKAKAQQDINENCN